MFYSFHFEVPLRYLPELMDGLAGTWKITSLSLSFGIIIALVGSASSISPIKLLRVIANVYVEIFRNTPAVVQLFFVYFGLPVLGVDLNPFSAALIALSLNHGAYLSEIIRSGIETVPKEQWESAVSLGLSRFKVLRYVVYPNAIKVAYPAICNQFIIGLLWVSLVSVISAKDMVFQASVVNSLTFRTFEIYIVVGVIYIFNVLLFTGFLKIVGLILFRQEAPLLKELLQFRAPQ
jgi:polar amino acid transport system permease protein